MCKILLSIALVTRNRPESLDRCLKSLRSESIQPFEVIISDDSDPEFASKTKAVAESWNCQYIIGPQLGLYANRNYAALACKGTHIRTMDDDHEFPNKHFEKCLLAVKSDPSSIWIIGEYLSTEKIGVEPHPCPGQFHPRGFSVYPKDTQNCWAISDGASIFPRNIFDCGIRYAEYFKFGYTYLEFGSRLYWLGYRIRHLQSTYVLHHLDINNRSFMLKDINLSSRIFTMLCYSFIYHKKWQNQLLFFYEINKIFIIEGGFFLKVFPNALSTYLTHFKFLKSNY
ncbi:MAG: glycosyltransferase family 2 protein [Nostoc sp.]